MYSVYADLRDKMGVRDSDVAKSLGLRLSIFSEWKTGRSTPKYDKLKLIADYFGVSVEYLTTGEQPQDYYLNEETAEMAQAIYDNQDLRLLFDVARDVSPEQLKLLHDLALSWKVSNR